MEQTNDIVITVSEYSRLITRVTLAEAKCKRLECALRELQIKYNELLTTQVKQTLQCDNNEYMYTW